MSLTLLQYARISQALSLGGFTESDVLSGESLLADEWQALRIFWDRKIADALGEEPGPLLAEYEAAIRESRSQLGRELAPLDQDPKAWFGLLRARAESPDPGFFANLGLTHLDVLNLQQYWTGQLSSWSPEERVAFQTAPSAVPNRTFPCPCYPKPLDPVGPLPARALS